MGAQISQVLLLFDVLSKLAPSKVVVALNLLLYLSNFLKQLYFLEYILLG